MMAEDLIGLLDLCPSEQRANRALPRCSSRASVRGRTSWKGQERRSRTRGRRWSLSANLLVLGALLDAGVPPPMRSNAWRGPLDGLQDFELGTGAIEVKTTLAASGFPATIWSLEQLDEQPRQPLFLAGVRLALRRTRATLPDDRRHRGTMLMQPRRRSRRSTRACFRPAIFDRIADEYIRRFTHMCERDPRGRSTGVSTADPRRGVRRRSQGSGT